MILNNIKTTILLSGMITLFSACVPKDVEVYEQGDQLLNCKQLTTKIADLIDTNYKINENTGMEAKSIAAWYIFIPLGGYNQFSASMARDKVDERFAYLTNLKKKNGCKFTHREIAFSKYKGRVSENLIELEKQQKQKELEEKRAKKSNTQVEVETQSDIDKMLNN